MKDFIKFVLTMSLTCVLVLTSCLVLSNVFEPKWIDHDGNMMTFIVKGYYEEEDYSLDVLITGNSDVYRGVDPMYMYANYGIASYNYVSAGQRSWIAYAMLKDALIDQSPQVILFNVDELFSDNQPSSGNKSKVYDNMRFSKEKIESVFDSDYFYTSGNGTAKKLTHFMPILAYHDRYKELSSDDFKYAYINERYVLKGMDMVGFYKECTNTNYMKYTTDTIEIPEVNVKNLNKMVEYARNRGIEFVLFEVPSADSWSYAKHKAILEYAMENNLTFIDLNTIDIGIDWSKDTSDGGDHLNLYGAEKVSDYLGNYLMTNYNLKDRRLDENYSYWDEDYEKYLVIKEQEKSYTE